MRMQPLRCYMFITCPIVDAIFRHEKTRLPRSILPTFFATIQRYNLTRNDDEACFSQRKQWGMDEP
jgi:hypothetical protein